MTVPPQDALAVWNGKRVILYEFSADKSTLKAAGRTQLVVSGRWKAFSKYSKLTKAFQGCSSSCLFNCTCVAAYRGSVDVF